MFLESDEFKDIMSDNTDSGINVTDLLESNIEIAVNDVDVEVTGNTLAMTPLPADSTYKPSASSN